MGFRGRFISNIIRFAGQQGADTRQLLILTGKDFSQLNDDALFFDTDVYSKVVQQAAEQTGDIHFGVHLGEYLSLSAAGVVAQIAQVSGTILEALEYMVEYANLGCQEMPFELRETSDGWIVGLLPNQLWLEQSPVAVRHTMDGTIVFTLREFRALTLSRHEPQRIDFAYPKPKSILEYERAFQSPVHFGREQTAIHLNKAHVEMPIVSSDYDLLRVLVGFAEQKIRDTQREAGFAATVKQSIINLVKPEFPTIDHVAANLNMSVRTLQRRLSDEGESYKSVIDNLRKHFATQYLQRADLSVKEIAYLLDYSDPSSFIRSFKRWHNTSPASYRKSINH
jgi:AraC-like DNA-binding protein